VATVNVPIRTVASTWRSPEIAVPSLSGSVKVQFTSDDWPAAPDGRTFDFHIEHSFDGGTTWTHWFGGNFTVGNHDKAGNLPSLFGPLDGIAKRVRVLVEPTASIRLGASVVVT